MEQYPATSGNMGASPVLTTDDYDLEYHNALEDGLTKLLQIAVVRIDVLKEHFRHITNSGRVCISTPVTATPWPLPVDEITLAKDICVHLREINRHCADVDNYGGGRA